MRKTTQETTRGLILGATLGDCVHVAGILNFLRLAESQGYTTHFLGAGARIGELVEAAVESDPEVIAVSFRLSPEVARPLIEELRDEIYVEYRIPVPDYDPMDMPDPLMPEIPEEMSEQMPVESSGQMP